MKTLIIYPAFALVFLTFAVQLVDIAESASTKSLYFAEDMNAAIDCAVKGIDLSVCAPELMEHDFSPEINRTIEVNSDLLDRLYQVLDEEQIQNITIDGDTIIIIQ